MHVSLQDLPDLRSISRATNSNMTPMRMCGGCRSSKPKEELVRIVRKPDGEICIDKNYKSDGRGVYVCKSEKCFDIACRKNWFKRCLKSDIRQETFDEIREYITALE